MTNEADRQTAGDDDRGPWYSFLPKTVPPVVQWVLLIALAVWLVTWVDPSAVESPYNGF